ncbi:hypothetical protein C8N24_2854 [Solirubrobacter pauli]|uniref:DUF2255 family protein n=1 Tax=Solirubrobacter pauli TaxID=166793 RepID=A0A660LD71_9ACTN|nr:DUF2255 family protein [Solirubrobacter pauli]RKQ92997.1 hypothetical protein C8N24_2854 [Solirubrobacter pauli]
MGAWTEDELRRIDGVQELAIAPVRRNGELRRATPIWVVRVDDDLYVRAAYGANKGWHGVARSSHQAQIRAGGVQKDVAIEDADAAVNDAVDAAYRTKYGHYASIVDSINDAEHRTTTLRLVP